MKMYADYYNKAGNEPKAGGLETFTKKALDSYLEAMEIRVHPCSSVRL